MKVSSNKISDIYSYYRQLLEDEYESRESAVLLSRVIAFYTGYRIPAAAGEKRVSESQLLKIHFAVKDLLTHKPLEYILGETDFYEMKFKVTPDVLIPRPETEELVDLIWRTAALRNTDSILDIGTGSGCIAITLQRLFDADVTAVDISEKAIEVARENAGNHGAEINFIRMDILNRDNRNFKKKFNLIVSNPPYVKNSEKDLMNRNVLDYEPDTALFVPDENPLIFYKAICDFAVENLKPNGKLYVEINESLGKETAGVFRPFFENVKVVKDLNGKDRFIIAEL